MTLQRTAFTEFMNVALLQINTLPVFKAGEHTHTQTRTHARTQVHATPPHVGNTLALLRICAFRRCPGALTRSSVSVLRTGCSVLRNPPPDSPDSLQPSGKTAADLQVSQQCTDSPRSLHYLCHMAQPFESCIISLSFIILYFLVGAGGF